MNATFRIGGLFAVLAITVIGCGPASGGQTGSVGPAATPAPPASPASAPSVAPRSEEPAAPQPPVEFTGQITCGPPVRSDRAGTQETIEIGDEGIVLTRTRRGAWLQTVTMSDPRLEGTIYNTYETDSYAMPGAETGPQVGALTHRIENAEGAWESRAIFASDREGSPIGHEGFGAPAEVLIGEGAYEGLIAIMEVTAELDVAPCGVEVRGIIFDGAPVPEPYKPGS